MRDGNVIALEIVVDIHFPVAMDHVVAPPGKLQSPKLETARVFRDVSEIGEKRLGGAVKIDEDESFPGFDAQRDHPHGAAIEKFEALHIRSPDQSPVQSVRPAMVCAPQDILAT